MKKITGISFGLIALIIIRVLIKSLVINGSGVPKEYQTELKTAKNRMDTLDIALKYNIIKADVIADTLLKSDRITSFIIKSDIEKGEELSEVSSAINRFHLYPKPIISALVNKIGLMVAKKNENFNFERKIPKKIDTGQFSVIKQCLSQSVLYSRVPTKNVNMLIYKDSQNAIKGKYIFTANGDFCLQLKNGERKYGTWKNVGKNNFECDCRYKDHNEILYFETTAKEIWKKV